MKALRGIKGEDDVSHHYSGPAYGFPHGDARLDLTDLYAFPKPGDAGKSSLIMNVHPSEGVNSAGPTREDAFATEAIYELKIDTDGDFVADIAYRVSFTSDKNGTQTATLRRVEGDKVIGIADDGQTIIERAPVSTAREASVTESGDHRIFAGWRSDPFFFDTMGALNNLQFTGDDFFTDKDVCSIVLEVPNSALGSGKIGLWHRTVDSTSGKWIQADRGALASQSVFLPGEEQAAYQAGQPADDARFIAVFAHSLEHTGGYMPRQQGELPAFCYRTSSLMIPASRDPIRPMAGHSPITPLMCFFPFLPTARWRAIMWGPTRTCSPRSHMLGRRTRPDLRDWWPPERTAAQVRPLWKAADSEF